jgi:hypothetical protein
MKLSKINYKSAVFFGVFSAIIYLFGGISVLFLNWQAPEIGAEIGIGETTLLQAIILTPLVGGIVVYLLFLFGTWVYNRVAKRYPISWEVKK